MTKSVEERFWEKVDKSAGPNGCWLWTASCNPGGYGAFGYHGSVTHAHRVAWELTNGSIPKGLGALHHCDNPPCVNPAHLFLGTQADNAKDAVSKGRMHPGEAHGRSKLTAADVLAIRAQYAEGGILQRELADAYSISPQQVYNIVHRRSWRHT